jgi:hypothetical protein
VVSLARGGRGEEKEVTAQFILVTKFPLGRIAKTENCFMNSKYPHSVSPTGRWLFFLGVPWLFGAVLTCTWRPLLHIIGEKILPYFLFFAPVAVLVVCMVLYDRLPQRLIISAGIVCWILAFLLLFWYFWFGPGAIGHH